MTTKQCIDGIKQDKTILVREIKIGINHVTILFLKQIIDTEKLSLYVITPLLERLRTEYENKRLTAEDAFYGVIETEDNLLLNINSKDSTVMSKIHDSYVCILFNDTVSYVAINLKNIAKKGVAPPELGDSLTAPKDAFTENLEINLSLLRYRIKDENLVIDNMAVGRRTMTMVSVCYIRDIANDKYVKSVIDKINKIDVDGIVASGQLALFLQDNKYSLFPQSGIVERSDTAAFELLRGKILVMVEGSGIAIITPKVFVEFLIANDDQYENLFFASFSKLLRIFAVFLSLVVTPLYIALVTYSTEILPAEYILTLAQGRVSIVFSAVVEVLIVEILIEVLKEALVRVPKSIGAAVGLVGATVIGQVAVSVGIFSPLLLLLASLSLLTSFIAPDYSIVTPLRIIKFVLIFLTGVTGFFGLLAGIFWVVCVIAGNKSNTVPYLAPFAPFNMFDVVKDFFSNQTTGRHRPDYLRPKDKVNRGK